MSNIIIDVVTKTIVETVYLTAVIIVIGFILGVLRNNSLKNFQRRFGSKSLMITGFIGVPIHELSHGLIALIFGHKITEIKLFQKPDANGTMGYVKHSYRKNNLYHEIGNFFIGIAPMFGGTISIIALMRFTIPISYFKLIKILEEGLKFRELNKEVFYNILISYKSFLRNIFLIENFKNPYFYLFLFLSICIASHISLSKADVKGSSKGLGVIFLLLLILNSIGFSNLISQVTIIKYNILMTSILILAVILSLITYVISIILLKLKI